MNKQENRNRSSQVMLLAAEQVFEAAAAVSHIRQNVAKLIKLSNDEETKLAIYHLDMTIAQLDTLASRIAMKVPAK